MYAMGKRDPATLGSMPVRLSPRAAVPVLLLGLLGGAVACAAEEGSDTGGEIPVGVNIELSGPAAVLGGSYQKALELVAEEANREGVLDGRRIRLVVRDNKSDPAEAVRVAKNLWDNERIVAMIGPGTSPTALPVVEEAERRKVPLFTFGSSGALVNPVTRHRYVFKIPPNNEDMAAVQVREIARRGLTTAGYLAPSDAFGDASLEAFEPSAREGGLTLTGVERFNPRDTDFTVPVTKLLAARPQAVAVAAITPASSLIAKAIRQAGFTGPVVYEGGAGAELFIQGAAGASEGMSMVFPRVLAANELPDTSENAKQKRFFAEYTRRHGQFSGFAPFAADAFAMIALAITTSGGTEPRRIRDAVESTPFVGLTGLFRFSPTYHGGVDPSALTVLTVRNGQWVLAG
jgi:branched-chain amino acid transport system substrate-binding protein